jgi:hypothetical protein
MALFITSIKITMKKRKNERELFYFKEMVAHCPYGEANIKHHGG